MNAQRAAGGIFFVFGFACAGWVSRIPVMRDRLHLEDRELGFLLLMTAAGAMVAFRGAGFLISRYGSRRVTQVSASLLCVNSAWPAFAPTPIWAAISLALIGASSGMLDVAMNAHGVEVERRLGRPILNGLHANLSLGSLTGAGAGALAAWCGLPPSGHLSLAALFVGGITFIFGRHLLRTDEDDSKRKEPRARLRASGPLVALAIVALCTSIAEGSMNDWAAVYLREILHTGEGMASTGFAVFSLAMVLGRWCGDRLTLQIGTVGILRGGGVLIAFGLTLAIATHHVAIMMVAILIVGLGVSVLAPVVFRAGGALPGVEPGAAIAMLATVSYSGFLLGPPLIGTVSNYAGLRGGFAAVVVLALVLASLARAAAASGEQLSSELR